MEETKYILLSGSSLNYVNSFYYKYIYINNKISFTNGLFIIFFDEIWKLSYKKNKTCGEIIYISKKDLDCGWESIKNKDNIVVKVFKNINMDNIGFVNGKKFIIDKKIGLEKSKNLIINYCYENRIKTCLYYENIVLRYFFETVLNSKIYKDIDLFLWVFDNNIWTKLEKINDNILNKKLEYGTYSISKDYPVFRLFYNDKIYLENSKKLDYQIVKSNLNYSIKLTNNISYDFFNISIYKLEKDIYDLKNTLVISKKNFVNNLSNIYLDDGIYYFKSWITNNDNVILSKEICYPENKKFIVNTKIDKCLILDIFDEKIYISNINKETIVLPKNKNILLRTSSLLTFDMFELEKYKDYILLNKNNENVCSLTNKNKVINQIFISKFIPYHNLSLKFLTESNKYITLKISITDNLIENDFLEADYFNEESMKIFNNFKMKINPSYNNIKVKNLKSKFIIGNGINLKNVKGNEGTIFSIVTNDGFEKTQVSDQGSLILKKDFLLSDSLMTQYIKNDLQIKDLECDDIHLNTFKINGKLLNNLNINNNYITNLNSILDTDAANKENLITKITNVSKKISNIVNFENYKIKDNIDCNFKRIKNIPSNKYLINKEFVDFNMPKFGLGLLLDNNLLKKSLNVKIDKSKSGISLGKNGLSLNNDFSKQDLILPQCKFYELEPIKKSGGLVIINNYVNSVKQKLINSGIYEDEGDDKLLLMSDNINNDWVSNKIVKTCISKKINILFDENNNIIINKGKLIKNKIELNLGLNRKYIIQSNKKINFKLNNLEFLNILKNNLYLLDTKNMKLSDNIHLICDDQIKINFIFKNYCSKY